MQTRPQPHYPYTKARGQWQIAGGVLFIAFFPCCACYIAAALLTQAFVARVDLGAIVLGALIVGGMMLSVFGAFTLLSAAFGMWWILEGRKALQYDAQLTLEGSLTWGVVTDRWTQWIRRKHYCIVYRFEIPATGYTSRAVIQAEYNPDVYRRCQVGERVLVRYLPENPAICRLELE